MRNLNIFDNLTKRWRSFGMKKESIPAELVQGLTDFMAHGGGGGSEYDDTAIKQRLSAIEGKESTWNAKQNAISDLATIRSGAALGATALQSLPSHSHDYSAITNKPSTFPPSAHQHTKSDITDFPTIPPAYDDTELSGRVSTLESALLGLDAAIGSGVV